MMLTNMVHSGLTSLGQQWIWFRPSAWLAGMTLIVLMAQVFGKTKASLLTYTLSLITLVIGAFMTWPLLDKTTSISLWILGDRTTTALMLCSWIFTGAALTYARGYLRSKNIAEGEFYTLMLTSLLGAQVLILSHHLLTFYLGLELMSLPLYALISVRRDDTLGPEAALKYFVMGAIASGLLLFGISLVYAVTKTMSLAGIAAALFQLQFPGHAAAIPLIIGIVFMLIAVSFKLGLVPFHMWSPDVYEGAPLPVMLYLSTLPKIAMVSALIHMILSPLIPHAPTHHLVFTLLTSLSVLSVLIGNIFALVQNQIKRLFAYSTMGHIGFIGLALSVGVIGERIAVFYVVTYALMSLAGFGLLTLMSQGTRDLETLDDLQGLSQRNGFMALLLLFVLLSMAGVPPFIGFMAKLEVLMLLVNAHHIGLAIFALIMSIVGAYYYLRMIKAMYFDKPVEHAAPVSTGKFSLGHIMILINSLAVLALGLFPTLLMGWL